MAEKMNGWAMTRAVTIGLMQDVLELNLALETQKQFLLNVQIIRSRLAVEWQNNHIYVEKYFVHMYCLPPVPWIEMVQQLILKREMGCIATGLVSCSGILPRCHENGRPVNAHNISY